MRGNEPVIGADESASGLELAANAAIVRVGGDIEHQNIDFIHNIRNPSEKFGGAFLRTSVSQLWDNDDARA
jgi:hypothetical protein